MEQQYSLVEIYPSYDSDAFQNDFKKIDSLLNDFEKLNLEDNIECIKSVIGILEEVNTTIYRIFTFIELNQAINTTDEKTTYYSNNLNAKLSNYAKTFRKKKDIYMLEVGSVYKNTFKGDIYDVSEANTGAHPVYRYGIPFFMGVR